jgi:hypothetical protein
MQESYSDFLYAACHFDPTKSALFCGNMSIFSHRCKSHIQISYMLRVILTPPNLHFFVAIYQFSVISRCIRKIINSLRSNKNNKAITNLFLYQLWYTTTLLKTKRNLFLLIDLPPFSYQFLIWQA